MLNLRRQDKFLVDRITVFVNCDFRYKFKYGSLNPHFSVHQAVADGKKIPKQEPKQYSFCTRIESKMKLVN